VKVKIYKTIILPVVLYGCETWSLILREVHKLRVFENRVLRRKFGPKRDGVTMLGGSPCHHSMARPRVEDGRDGLQLKVSCEYME
jgi:hypothetical protein